MSLSRTALSAALLMAIAGTASAANATSEQAKNRALTNLMANPKAAHVNGNDRLAASYAVVDATGEHVRFQRTYAGLDVIGGDFVVHSRGGAIRSVSQTLSSSARPSLRPSINRFRGV